MRSHFIYTSRSGGATRRARGAGAGDEADLQQQHVQAFEFAPTGQHLLVQRVVRPPPPPVHVQKLQELTKTKLMMRDKDSIECEVCGAKLIE